MNTLITWREAANMSRAALGRKVGCTGQAIGQIESGKIKPSLYLAARIAEAVGQPLSVVFPELAEQAELVARVQQTSKRNRKRA